MEEKKSYKADLEHRRPWVFLAALVGTVAFFVAVLFIPFKAIGEWTEELLDDYSMDLDLDLKDKEDLIAAAQPQEVIQKREEAPKLNKVEETAEEAPEMIENEQPPLEQEVEEEEDTPPINLNGDDEEKNRIAQELPEYPGGMVEFMKWLTATLKYPENALRYQKKGRVMASFIVNADGSISDIKLTQGVHPDLDAEVLRVLRLMPKWKPGIENGRFCRSKVAIPVVFDF